MPALSFKAQFADLVASGRKPHSIRAWRKTPFKAGDDLSFFSGMRTKACRRLRPNTRCLGATPIEVNARMRYVHLNASSIYYPRQFSGMLFPEDLSRLAKMDGFESVDAFFSFFEESAGGILCGQLIEWAPRCCFGCISGFAPHCPHDATWVSTFRGARTGPFWCDEHKVDPITPHHAIELIKPL